VQVNGVMLGIRAKASTIIKRRMQPKLHVIMQFVNIKENAID
jgi:hypothetical protein